MMDIVTSVREHVSGWNNGGEASWYARAFQTSCFHTHEHVTQLPSRQLFLKLHSASPNSQGSDDLYTAYNTLLTATLSSWSKQKYFTPPTFVAFIQSVLSGLPSTSSSTTEPSSLTWLGGSLVDMIWSIDIELDELVVEAKSSEGTSGDEQQRNGERDKQAVADLVKKLLVCEYMIVSSVALNSSPLGCRNCSTRSLQRKARYRPGLRCWSQLRQILLGQAGSSNED